MAKATKKRKVQMPGSIRTKLTAAFCMLLVSAVMMVSATYAWFTLSTAPEVRNIATSAVGNGSLEIALMPETGLFSELGTGLASENHSGKVAVKAANNTWGNIVELNDVSYGLSDITLLPATLNTADVSNITISTTAYGKDGRPSVLETKNAATGTFESTTAEDGTTTGTFYVNSKYGVRAIGTSEENITVDDSYAYAVDLAFRTNIKNAKLVLQTDAVQRVYKDSTNEATMGGGSTMTIINKDANLDITKLVQAIRVTFIQNYGNGDVQAVKKVLGTAKLDAPTTDATTGATTAKLYMYDKTGTKLTDANAIISPLEKDAATQITAVVWLDGTGLTNADVGVGANSFTAQLNLQFATDVELNPASNTSLFGIKETTGGTTDDSAGN